MARNKKSSAYADKHAYLQPHRWASGELAFYLNSQTHATEKYMDFHRRQQAEAGRLGRQ